MFNINTIVRLPVWVREFVNFADTNSLRFALASVRLEPVEGVNDAVWVVATDGRALVRVKIVGEHNLMQPILIPAASLKRIPVGAESIVVQTVDYGGGSICWRLVGVGKRDKPDTLVEFEPVEGRFPSWQQVVRPEITGTEAVNVPRIAAHFSSKLGDLFQRVAKVEGVDPLGASFDLRCPNADNQGNAVVVTTDAFPDLLAVVMPMTRSK